MKLVLIAGASASGKTELARQLLKSLNETETNAILLKTDDYYREIPEGIDIDDYRQKTNFDTPDIFEFDLLAQHLIDLHEGIDITKAKEFDFKTNKRVGRETISPPDVLIIEGLFALDFAKKYLKDSHISKTTVFVETDFYLDIVNRRIDRDLAERGRNNKEEILRQERQFVGPAFFSTICKSKNGVDISVDNSEKIVIKHDPAAPGSAAQLPPTHPLMRGVDEIIAKLQSQQERGVSAGRQP